MKKYKVKNGKEHKELMYKIDALMKKGERQLTDKEAADLRAMALAVQAYEESIYTIPAPSTIEGMVELKMYEHKLNQAKLAEKMGMAKSKVSEILTGKRKPDVAFLKGAYKYLKIDPAFLLEHA